MPAVNLDLMLQAALGALLITLANVNNVLAVFGTRGILAGLLFLAVGFGVGWVVVAIVGLLFLMPLSRVLARDWGPPWATTNRGGRR